MTHHGSDLGRVDFDFDQGSGSYSSGPTDDGTFKSGSTIPRSKMIHPVLNISYIAGLKDHCGLQMASEVTVDLRQTRKKSNL